MQVIAWQLPPDVGLVVGVPRSGLLAGSILALQLNLALTDLQGFLDGREIAVGKRPVRAGPGARARRAVVVDDSIGTGSQFRLARAQVEDAGLSDGVLYATAFVTPQNRGLPDLYAEVVDDPRVFGWNLMHHPKLLSRTCFDIDGVLCVDPLDEENDDGERYTAFVRNARPLFVPSSSVGYVVTSRLEKYRWATEEWLRNLGIEYRELVMMDLESAVERQALAAHGRAKAEFYARSDAELFLESDYRQAAEIAERSGRQVYAMDRREMVYPTPLRAATASTGALLRSARAVPPAQALYWSARARIDQAMQAVPRGLKNGVKSVLHRV